MNKPRLIAASATSAIITIVFVVVITIWAEFSVPLKDWLKNFSGHHWTSKSIFSLLLFAAASIVVYASPYKYSDERLKRTLQLVLIFTVLGTAALTLFFTGHHLGVF
ncbi:MAG: hypothetical protein AAB588_06340 [Patescibacteria group bacterium]